MIMEDNDTVSSFKPIMVEFLFGDTVFLQFLSLHE